MSDKSISCFFSNYYYYFFHKPCATITFWIKPCYGPYCFISNTRKLPTLSLTGGPQSPQKKKCFPQTFFSSQFSLTPLRSQMDSCALLATANRYVQAIYRPKHAKTAGIPRLALSFRRSGANSRRRSRFRGEILKSEAMDSVADDGGLEKIGKKEWVHFVGIGGSGLSALAMLALKQVFIFFSLI